MPPKKKKGKASKLARMSDEERLRYLQHRADVELEAKRRKQQLIAAFTKNKVKREEAFARINTAKLNEQWRNSLRQIKCVELKKNVEFLRQDFDEMLRTKDEFIKILYNELVESDLDHRRFQKAHMIVVDDIIEKGRERMTCMYKHHTETVNKIASIGLTDLRNRKIKMKEYITQLKTIIFAKHKRLEAELDEIKTRNAVNVYNVIFTKEESISQLKREIYPKMENLWQEINDVITSYENSTESKRKQYEYLKEQDDAHQAETAQFPKIFAGLRETAETLRKDLINLTQEREETIEDLQMQSELLSKRVWEMRQEMKMNQTLDAVQLKRLSVLSSEVLADLERILDKVLEIKTMGKLCSDMEPISVKVKKYSLKNLETPKEISKSSDETLGFLKKIEGFRDHLYCIKEENIFLKQERHMLLEENNRLKHSLKSYLISVSRMPTIRPRTRV